MDLFLFSIEDLKVGTFNPPYAASGKEEAVRLLQAASHSEGSLLRQFPDDFRLWCVGTFAPGSGEIVADLELVGVVSEFVKEVRQ